MISLSPHIPTFIFHEPIDFRAGIDKLAALAVKVSGEDPFSGTLFLFRNRHLTSAKLLLYDGLGFWYCQRRLSQGRFPWWPGDRESARLDHHQIMTLLQGIDPRGLAVLPWRQIGTTGCLSRSQNRNQTCSSMERSL